MYHFDTVKRIVDELYPLRQDKEATAIYYERILIADIRFFEWESSHYEWHNLHKLYGASYMEPIFVSHENEIDKEDAENVRRELLRVLRNDISFGYIISLLDPQINEPTQLQIEQAVHADLEMSDNISDTTSKEVTGAIALSTKEYKNFEDYFVKNDAEKYIPFIRKQLEGIKGKGVAIVIRALNEAGIITLQGGNARIYESIKKYFNINPGSDAGINKYMSGAEKDTIKDEVEKMKQVIQSL